MHREIKLDDLVALDLLEPMRSGTLDMMLIADSGEEMHTCPVEICPN
jgi:hypothetical protein